MTTRVIGRNIDLGDAIRQQAEQKLDETIKKYADGLTSSSHVTIVKEGAMFRTECNVRLQHGQEFHVSGDAPEAYASLSAAIEKIAKQLRRDKRRRCSISER